MVSIVILIQDRFAFVKRCIDSILEQTKSNYELILIVQGYISEDLSDYLMGLKSSGVKGEIVVNQENTGVTPGRNQGIRMSKGDYILFFDDDAFVNNNLDFIPEDEKELDWLERMKKNFTEGVGVVAQTGYYIDPRRKGIFFEAKTRGSYCDVGQGYCFMFSRDVVNKIGTLDPFFGRFWHEESEYALRAKDAGFGVKTSGYVGVHHEGSGSGDDGTYSSKYEYMYNKWRHKFDTILVGRNNWQ
jgi:GT2 family glycosyltransferase